jgi:hypothetical protein
VAGPYRPYDDDVVVVYWLIVGESGVDTCPVPGECCEDTWPNPEAPRVTHFWFIWLCKTYVGVRGVRPPDLPFT